MPVIQFVFGRTMEKESCCLRGLNCDQLTVSEPREVEIILYSIPVYFLRLLQLQFSACSAVDGWRDSG